MGEESAMKPGIAVGGGAPRECAAFLLDHEGRAGVPCTGMVRLTHSTLLRGGKAEVQLKAGSLQRFVPHECTSEDVGTALFDADQVHAIGIFDMRTFNMDRNSDNLLVVRGGGGGGGGARLVPIDHGYILPSYRHLEDPLPLSLSHTPPSHSVLSRCRRAARAARKGCRLAATSLAEKRSFLDAAGPVHKAEEAVKVANRAYNTAVMQLAHAETSAESVSAAHPKLQQAAMAKVDKFRLASRRMEELVQSATARLNGLEGRDGPVTDLDSHYQTPRIRAEAKLKEAARLHAKALAAARRAAVLRSDVKVQVPELRAAIKAADALHDRYEGLVRRQTADQAAYAR
eukprot:CAMPEP_0172188930 /NCGR_PEP_ID=MMETSP1050-20130122/22228_1 /TAXON_ID=233186 /ORGANISM="Cryptomonas curvata, Strain CCAP979/52" /LENGTH=343 /DNA_ID=CAMNT_0012863541 /DNA_START=48 /DNA_END=1075 /DNA_ORIENTATION=-